MTPDIPAVIRAVAATTPGDPSSYDLGGFRLGMDEEAVLANAKARGMRPGIGTERHVDFESQVRSQINTRGGIGGSESGRSVLGKATLRDEAGGRYMLSFLAWPDGAHLYEIAYLAPQGTSAAEWRRMLVEKWGRPGDETLGEELSARWRGAGDSGATASATLGPRGGHVQLKNPDGTRDRQSALVAAAVDTHFSANSKKPSL